jgi:hypothetical protein
VATLCVPKLEPRGKEWPSLGPYVVEFLTGHRLDGTESDRWSGSIFGPGSLKGQQYRMDAEKIAATLRAYEIYPPDHPLAGRRRFKRVGLSWRKGTAKTEWAAQICYGELHEDGPVRFAGWETTLSGDLVIDPILETPVPKFRPVNDPYIPMVAYTEDQAEELAYGALMVIVGEGPDADRFDVALERIIRLNDRGFPDGKAVALSGSPNANDGARTTFQHFDETHRMELPRLVAAHETMLGNIPKRTLDDPWSLETTTAGRPGANSVAEGTHKEAQMIADGKIDDPELFYFHREASAHHDLSKLDGRIAAVAEATGPAGEYGPGQFRDIAKQWERPNADTSYLERVWLNRWTRSDLNAYDVGAFSKLGKRPKLTRRAFVTVGFDGARFKDATGFVLTDIQSGVQQPYGLWERPEDVDDWEVPIDEVNAVFDEIMERFDVWQVYGDPPHYVETMATWASKHPDHVTEWWTNRRRPMHEAAKAYQEAINTGVLGHTDDPDDPDNRNLIRHVGNAGRYDTNLLDEQGKKIWILTKIQPHLKFDLCMAAVLSWRARLDALAKGAKPSGAEFVPYRIR